MSEPVYPDPQGLSIPTQDAPPVSTGTPSPRYPPDLIDYVRRNPLEAWIALTAIYGLDPYSGRPDEEDRATVLRRIPVDPLGLREMHP